MYAIVEIAGKQYRVEKNRNIKVPHLHAETGGKIQFDRVLFVNDDKGQNLIGTPVVDGMVVSGTVVEHGKDKTIIVFKKKRRKGYQKKNGHRQQYSIIKIDDIGAVKAAKKEAAKKVEPAPKAKAAAKSEKAEVKAEKPAAKKTAAKKPAATQKTPVKKSAPNAKAKPAAKKTAATDKPKPAAKKAAPAKKAVPAKKSTAKKDKPADKKEA